jgi:hypothetical protein
MGGEDIILLSLFELSRAHEWFRESIMANGPAQYIQQLQLTQLTTTVGDSRISLHHSVRVESTQCGVPFYSGKVEVQSRKSLLELAAAFPPSAGRSSNW